MKTLLILIIGMRAASTFAQTIPHTNELIGSINNSRELQSDTTLKVVYVAEEEWTNKLAIFIAQQQR